MKSKYAPKTEKDPKNNLPHDVLYRVDFYGRHEDIDKIELVYSVMTVGKKLGNYIKKVKEFVNSDLKCEVTDVKYIKVDYDGNEI